MTTRSKSLRERVTDFTSSMKSGGAACWFLFALLAPVLGAVIWIVAGTLYERFDARPKKPEYYYGMSEERAVEYSERMRTYYQWAERRWWIAFYCFLTLIGVGVLCSFRFAWLEFQSPTMLGVMGLFVLFLEYGWTTFYSFFATIFRGG